MKKLLLLSLIIITNSVTADVDKVFDNLKPFFPTIKTENISSSELEGFYEVVLTTPQIEVLYISLDGRYVIQGAVTDIELMANLSTKRINSEKIKILNSIDENNKIVFKAENEQYILHVFTDVDCPYCAKLHANMQAMNSLGITVKYLASPIEQLHPNAQSAMEKIWCAEDKAIAMHNYKTNRYLPDSPDCINPVEDQLAISKQLGVNGTPSIFLENGSNIPGYQEPNQLLNSILQAIAQ
ncbi:MAG: DsbC family protein [Gammaproteobacteria bacterium]|jgi:thiol:disulfide interchange protein DsbC|nr:DsbC family protein [SAR86 cluster bacterium]MBT4587113.1 DsbC family protein [Gammaproteobacteria bacterium]MDP0560681.1 DsbC family protein [Candidatus Thioglobus sp.]MBT4975413.1 DsbC family protein [Gammaproteobacteria bacterium]MBT5547836.1 DsbC family protein [Gammaproteobacteria bacterium]